MLRLTHLSRRRDHWHWDLDEGWCLRFTGDSDEFDDMRDDLKTWGRTYAQWLPDYEWDDGKEGAWWVTDHLFRDSYTDCFTNWRDAMLATRSDDAVQWIWKYKYGWGQSKPYREYRTAHTEPKPEPEPPSLIPAHLRQEYSLLGVGATATLKEVKEAYRQLSKTHHPDAGGSHLAFIALQQAYARVSRWVELFPVNACPNNKSA